jgi:hypothetical protein
MQQPSCCKEEQQRQRTGKQRNRMHSVVTQRVKGSISGKANEIKARRVKLSGQLPFLG